MTPIIDYRLFWSVFKTSDLSIVMISKNLRKIWALLRFHRSRAHKLLVVDVLWYAYINLVYFCRYSASDQCTLISHHSEKVVITTKLLHLSDATSNLNLPRFVIAQMLLWNESFSTLTRRQDLVHKNIISTADLYFILCCNLCGTHSSEIDLRTAENIFQYFLCYDGENSKILTFRSCVLLRVTVDKLSVLE